VEARLRRRKELARGWRFACACERCAAEGIALGDRDSGVSLVASVKGVESMAKADG
jgi:hypothetical protein